MRKKSFTSLKNLDNKTVLVRVDFNVPLERGVIKDDFKLAANLPLVKYLSAHGAKVLLITHWGQPVLPPKKQFSRQQKFSVAPLAKHLSKLLGKKVVFIGAPVGSRQLIGALTKLKGGQLALLENLRFYTGETANDQAFAKQLAGLADYYINNAFAVSHRQHASVAAIKKLLPSFAGPLLMEEVDQLNRVLKPVRPLVAIVGGAKIESKIALLKNLLKRANWLLVGGALANNFLAARGHEIGKSLATKEGVRLARKIKGRKLVLPIDLVVINKAGRTAWRRANEVKRGEVIVDIGPETMKLFASHIKTAATIVWNGPMGKFEEERSRLGTLFVGRVVASRASGRAFGLVGGGETVEALRLTKMIADVDWVSTGGGATLAYLAGSKLPGLSGLIK